MSNHSEYLNKVLLSRVYDVAVETPLDEAVSLSRRLGNRVLLKRDDLQPVFSFKLRGAYNKMARLSPEELRRGVIAASAGNHAQGVALAARRLGCEAVIVMPVTTPAIKVDAVRRLGGQVVLFGESFSDAWRHTLDLIKETGYVFIPPFDDPDVIAGQGTIGMEILRQHPDPIHAIFVPIGGGGLAAGVAAYVPTGSRMRVLHLPEGRLLIDDCYNANPQAMTEALKLLSVTPSRRRLAVLGDMGELGELTVSAHRAIGVLAGELHIDAVIAVGEKARGIAAEAPNAQWYAAAEDALPAVRAAFGPDTALLVKASHAMHMETIVKELEAQT